MEIQQSQEENVNLSQHEQAESLLEIYKQFIEVIVINKTWRRQA
jgi:hypothetical protein